MEKREPNPTLGVVIPCFNEQEVLPDLVKAMQAMVGRAPGPVLFLLVNDGSTDDTRRLLDAACAADPRFAALHFSRNFGHQTAVTAGLREARGDVIAVIDADLQDPPDVILDTLARWREGYEVVYGVRRNRKEGLFLRAAYAAFYRALRRIAHVDLPVDAGDFALMDRRVVDEINRMPEHNRYVRGLRGWVGFRQIGLPYERAARRAGVPKYNMRRLSRLAANGIVSFSPVPLRVASWLGPFAALIGFLLLVWALFSVFLLNKLPPGWASLAVMILFIGGVQLLVLGIIGEYIGSIFDEVKNRPHYIVRSTAGWLTPSTPAN